MAETANERTEAAEGWTRAGWGWRVVYGVLVVGPLVWMFFAREWWHCGALALFSVLVALQMLRAEQRHAEAFKGHCPFCRKPFFEGDRECPHCERTIPRELWKAQGRR